MAAGSSSRMQGADKITLPLAGMAVLGWSVQVLQDSPLVDRIVLVNSQSNIEQVECLAADRKWHKVEKICLGGERRQDSVAAGLKTLSDCEWVIIHDGARPFLSEKLIKDGLEAAAQYGAAVAAVPVTDTIKITDSNGVVSATPPREQLWAVQTPQIFKMSLLLEAYQKSCGDVTDDAMLLEQCGYKVKIYRGSYDNIKITTPRDLELAELLAGKYLHK